MPFFVPFAVDVASNAASKLDPAVFEDCCESEVVEFDADLGGTGA